MNHDNLCNTHLKEKTVQKLIDFHNTDQEIRYSVRQEVKEFNGAESNVLLELLKDPSSEIRYKAAYALCILDNLKYLPDILQLLRDAHSDVRWGICDLMHDYGDERAIESLLKIILYDPEGDIRYMACYALSKIGNEQVIPILQQVIEIDKGADFEGRLVRDMAIRAIELIQERLKHT